MSLTENLDAMEAVKHIPLQDREAFKYALVATLVKNTAHWRAFETVFEVYFSLRVEPSTASTPTWRSSEDPDAPEGAGQGQGQGEGQGSGGGAGEALSAEQLAEMLAPVLPCCAATTR